MSIEGFIGVKSEMGDIAEAILQNTQPAQQREPIIFDHNNGSPAIDFLIACGSKMERISADHPMATNTRALPSYRPRSNPQ